MSDSPPPLLGSTPSMQTFVTHTADHGLTPLLSHFVAVSLSPFPRLLKRGSTPPGSHSRRSLAFRLLSPLLSSKLYCLSSLPGATHSRWRLKLCPANISTNLDHPPLPPWSSMPSRRVGSSSACPSSPHSLSSVGGASLARNAPLRLKSTSSSERRCLGSPCLVRTPPSSFPLPPSL